MQSDRIPGRCDVLVVGGGPAGSSAATLLARAGLDVVLLEKAKHPRPQVGESLIPHFWHFADQLGFTPKLEAEGFLAKAGGLVAWEGKLRQIRFADFGYVKRGGLHVERDRFDLLLLRHAAECGARVFEEVAVSGVDFAPANGPAVQFSDRRGGGDTPGRIECRQVVDASGFWALLANQFRSKRLHDMGGRKFLSLWGYYRNASFIGPDARIYPVAQLGKVKPVTFVSTFENGWAWHIILRDCTSVGLLLYSGGENARGRGGYERYFRETCASIPILRDLLAPASLIEGSFFARPDYSYVSDRIVGNGFYCIGDAAAFLDPIFSTGVTTAMYHAALCAWAIEAAVKRADRREFYNRLFRDKVVQYYSIARLLIFGDFGAAGVEPELVKAMARSLPPNEVDLLLSAASMVARPQHLAQIAIAAGLSPELATDRSFAVSGVTA